MDIPPPPPQVHVAPTPMAAQQQRATNVFTQEELAKIAELFAELKQGKEPEITFETLGGMTGMTFLGGTFVLVMTLSLSALKKFFDKLAENFADQFVSPDSKKTKSESDNDKSDYIHFRDKLSELVTFLDKTLQTKPLITVQSLSFNIVDTGLRMSGPPNPVLTLLPSTFEKQKGAPFVFQVDSQLRLLVTAILLRKQVESSSSELTQSGWNSYLLWLSHAMNKDGK